MIPKAGSLKKINITDKLEVKKEQTERERKMKNINTEGVRQHSTDCIEILKKSK